LGFSERDQSSKETAVTTFLLLPGAGGRSSYWDRVTPRLTDAGHDTIAVDLPGPDPAAGRFEYAEIVAAAAFGHSDLVLVVQSLGGFTAAMTAGRIGAKELVFVNAMIPEPGETPGQWWEATGSVQAREIAAALGGYGPFEVETYFLHDVDVTGLADEQHFEADTVFQTPCDFSNWPDIPILVLVGADDRFSG
jgi:pimeloyl-ACP methyl ester carboxylesterase